jgi:hypothetical protein
VEFELRVKELSASLDAARAGSAGQAALLAGIAHELIERPLAIISRSRLWPAAKPPASDAAEALAVLRESVGVIERVYELQRPDPCDAGCDLEVVAREVAPILRAALGDAVDVRVVRRPGPGPILTPMPDWCVAILMFAVSIALVSTHWTEWRDEGEYYGVTDDDADWIVRGPPELRDSSQFPVASSPPPGRGAITIDLQGMGDLVRVYIETDLADATLLPLGVVDPDVCPCPPEPHSGYGALLLAAACAKPWDGSVSLDVGHYDGAEATIFLAGSLPPNDGWRDDEADLSGPARE